MRYSRKWQLAFVCLLALGLLPFAPAPRGTAQAPGYTITDLGTLGGERSTAFGLDECGRVVGESQAAADSPPPGATAPFRPFHWNNGVMTDLGTLGGLSGTATALNQGGTVVGYSLTAVASTHAFIRPAAGPMQDLGTLGGPFAEAHDINASGQVVGVSDESGGNILQDRAFIWQSGTGMQGLTATWGTPVRAFGINDAGQVAGSANLNPSGTHAFVTIGGDAKDLGTLGGDVSFATEVNDLGEVAGYSYIPIPPNTITPSYHAFRWKDANGNSQSDVGEMLDLGVLAGHRNSVAYDLNDNGVVVGYSETGATDDNNVKRAFIWTSADGLRDLNTVAQGTGWTLHEARGVNDRGQIVGTGLNPGGKVHAFLLTPTDAGPSPCDPTPTPTPVPVPGTLQFSGATYSVGENGGSVVISVSRTGGSEGAVSVGYATSTGGTATAGSDYTATSGTLNFAHGETTKTFSVTVNEDTLDEADETVNLTLSGPGGGATLGSQSTAVLTITDNDAQPTLQFDSATYTVGEGGVTATITVSRAGGSNGGVTVNYATSDGTATAGSDYNATSGTLNFAAGDNSETFTVAVTNDALDEPDETVTLTLSSPGGGGALGTQSTAALTINDNDAAPTISVGDAAAVNEGDAGTASATFAVTLSAASGQTVTVSYATADVTAVAPGDYTAVGLTTLTFNPGETSKNVSVAVVGDTTDEPNETFNVNLSSPTNATINDGQGVGTINDDDGAPSLSINDVTVTEGNSGTTAATFTVTLSAASGRAVSVNYATVEGTASAGSDYAPASGTLNFAAGETTKTVNVNVNGDTANEGNENFFFNLSAPVNAGIADAAGQGTITNDDTPALRFSQDSYPVGESAHFVTVTVTRTGDTAPAVGVSFATSDGTATERRDYTAVAGRLQFAAGETSKTFDVLLTEDAYQEALETINLTLSNPTGGAALGSQSTATVNIAADDNPPPNFNPIDISSDFVRQHYHDFLNREPDASGLAFWTGEIEQCGADAQCREVKRINVSAAFFLSIEFQQTGYLVYRTYKAAYGDATSPNVDGTVPVVRLREFLPDTRSIGDGVVVGQLNWEQRLEANKTAYMAEFVQRQRFLTAYPTSLTAAQFVDKLNQNAGGVLTQAERDQLVAQLSADPSGTAPRANVLRAVSENAALQQNEFRRAFVLMQFYGYLRRNPDDPQDTDFRGWKFWLDKLNQFNGNYVQAEMVKAFLDSIEYRTRFAP